MHSFFWSACVCGICFTCWTAFISTHEFFHFYDSSFLPLPCRGEWASSCVVLNWQLGLNRSRLIGRKMGGRAEFTLEEVVASWMFLWRLVECLGEICLLIFSTLYSWSQKGLREGQDRRKRVCCWLLTKQRITRAIKSVYSVSSVTRWVPATYLVFFPHSVLGLVFWTAELNTEDTTSQVEKPTWSLLGEADKVWISALEKELWEKQGTYVQTNTSMELHVFWNLLFCLFVLERK